MTNKGRSRSAPVSALLGLTGGGGLLMVGATLGALVATLWWPLDLLTSFHPQYAVILAAVGFFHLLLRSRISAAVFLMAALVNVSLVAPFVIGGGPSADAPGPRLSVLSFNVGVSNPNRSDIAAYVGQEQPDLLFVIESSFEWEGALAASGPPMTAVAIVPRGRVSGITVMANPAIGARSVPLDFTDPGEAVAVEVRLDGQRVVVLVLHPPSPTSGERAAKRDAVLAAAGAWVATVDAPVLVVGDLNSTPWSSAFRSLQVQGRLLDSSRGAGLQPTWPSGWGAMMIPIDHALHTGELAVVERRTGPPMGSAHRPLLVTVAASG